MILLYLKNQNVFYEFLSDLSFNLTVWSRSLLVHLSTSRTVLPAMLSTAVPLHAVPALQVCFDDIFLFIGKRQEITPGHGNRLTPPIENTSGDKGHCQLYNFPSGERIEPSGP